MFHESSSEPVLNSASKQFSGGGMNHLQWLVRGLVCTTLAAGPAFR